jgi:MFS family permease
VPLARPLRGVYAVTFCQFGAIGMFLTGMQLYVKDELAGSKAAVGVAIGAFSVTAVLSRPIVGRGVDVRGRKPFLYVGLGLLVLSSLGFLVAHSLLAVVTLRLVQGVNGACVYTCVASMATDLAPADKRASAIARMSLFQYAGIALGPSIASALVDGPGYPAVWMLAAAFGVAGLAVTVPLPESGRETMTARAGAGPGVRRIIHPAAVGPGLVLLSAGIGYSAVTSFGSLYARHVDVGDGTLYAVFAVTVIAVRIVSGTIADLRGAVGVARPGLLLSAAGLLVMAVFQRPEGGIVGVGVFGLGFALVFPALMAFAVGRVADHERGEMLGSFTAFLDVGMGGGAYLIGAIADAAGFGAAYATPALLCVAGAVLLTVIARAPSPAAVADR